MVKVNLKIVYSVRVSRENCSRPCKRRKSNRNLISLTRRANRRVSSWFRERSLQPQSYLYKTRNSSKQLHRCSKNKASFQKVSPCNINCPTTLLRITSTTCMYKTIRNRQLNSSEKLLSLTCININLTASRPSKTIKRQGDLPTQSFSFSLPTSVTPKLSSTSLKSISWKTKKSLQKLYSSQLNCKERKRGKTKLTYNGSSKISKKYNKTKTTKMTSSE